jgi:lactoylglutathione lyase
MQMAEHVGYICAAKDPDGNVIEFSHNQKVYATIQRVWGNGS